MTELVLELLTDPYRKSYGDVRDYCFRLNGEILSLPQNKEEDEMMDKTIWDYQLKRYANNLTRLNDEAAITQIAVAAETKWFDQDTVEQKFIEMGYPMHSRQQTYPAGGKLELFHPFTGAPLKEYREGYIWPQTMSYFMFPQQCITCTSSVKVPKIGGNPFHSSTQPFCFSEKCSVNPMRNYICMFTQEPSFTIRGLCKDAVMDTQYKLADHVPGDGTQGVNADTRSYVGPKGWVISRNKTDARWRMSHYYYTDLTLTMLDADALPVGRHKWLVENNVCNEGLTSPEELLISGCDDTQFTCDDGKCLDISQRCNNVEVFISNPFYLNIIWNDL